MRFSFAAAALAASISALSLWAEADGALRRLDNAGETVSWILPVMVVDLEQAQENSILEVSVWHTRRRFNAKETTSLDALALAELSKTMQLSTERAKYDRKTSVESRDNGGAEHNIVKLIHFNENGDEIERSQIGLDNRLFDIASNGKDSIGTQQNYLFRLEVNSSQAWPSVPVVVKCAWPEMCRDIDLETHGQLNLIVDGYVVGKIAWGDSSSSLKDAREADSDDAHPNEVDSISEAQQRSMKLYLSTVPAGNHTMWIEVVDKHHPEIAIWPSPSPRVDFVSTASTVAPPAISLISPVEGDAAQISETYKAIELRIHPDTIPPSRQVLVDMVPLNMPDLEARQGTLTCDETGTVAMMVENISKTSSWELAVRPVDGNGQLYKPEVSQTRVVISLEILKDGMQKSQTDPNSERTLKGSGGMGGDMGLLGMALGSGAQIEHRDPVVPHLVQPSGPRLSHLGGPPSSSPTNEDAGPKNAETSRRVRCRISIAATGRKVALAYDPQTTVASLLSDPRVGLEATKVHDFSVYDSEGFEIMHSEMIQDFCVGQDVLTIMAAESVLEKEL